MYQYLCEIGIGCEVQLLGESRILRVIGRSDRDVVLYDYVNHSYHHVRDTEMAKVVS